MQTMARITRVDGKYIVSYVISSPVQSVKEFDDFRSAYISACEYMNWLYQYVAIEIYPEEIEKAIKEIQNKREEEMIMKEVETCYKKYLDANEKVEKFIKEKKVI